MQFVDFFSGIGGIRLGLERARHKCVGWCEFDKFARKSYEAMFNTKGEWTSVDVRTVKPYDVPTADLWTFGFPCQDISVAGKQKGLQKGERSGLFYEIMRLLAGRRQEDKPGWLLIENVKNLLSIGNGFDFARVLLELEGLGYECEWQVLNSKDFGVPQNRERVFVVGHLGGIGGRKVFPIAAADGENPCKLQELTQGVRRCKRVCSTDGLSCTLSAVGGGGGEKTELYAVPCRINKPIGEGSCSQLSIKEINNQTAGCLSSRYYKGLAENGCNAVITIQKTHGKNVSLKSDETDTLQAARLDDVCGIDLSYKRAKTTKLARCLQARYNKGPCNRESETTGVLIAGNAIKRETDEACTLDASYYKAFGCNQQRTGIMVAPVLTPEREEKRQNGRRMKEPDEPMFTLTAQDRHGVAISGLYTNCRDDFFHGPLEGLSRTLKGSKYDAAVTDGMRIRKLTPRECWRLQGFPDEYFDKAKAAGVSDSQLYKQAGNAVTVNVAEVIGRKLKEVCNNASN